LKFCKIRDQKKFNFWAYVCSGDAPIIWQFFWQSSKFCTKIKILVKNRNFLQKSKFWSKITILVKNHNFGQKSQFWSKIEILFIEKSS